MQRNNSFVTKFITRTFSTQFSKYVMDKQNFTLPANVSLTPDGQSVKPIISSFYIFISISFQILASQS